VPSKCLSLTSWTFTS